MVMPDHRKGTLLDLIEGVQVNQLDPQGKLQRHLVQPLRGLGEDSVDVLHEDENVP